MQSGGGLIVKKVLNIITLVFGWPLSNVWANVTNRSSDIQSLDFGLITILPCPSNWQNVACQRPNRLFRILWNPQWPRNIPSSYYLQCRDPLCLMTSPYDFEDFEKKLDLKNVIKIHEGVVQKLRWQDFGLFWPPTYLWLTFLKEFHAIYVVKCTLRWHFPYYLPTSSCQRSFWMTPYT